MSVIYEKSYIFVAFSSMQAIILSLTRKSDKAVLVHAFTKEQGLVLYTMYGAGSRKKSIGSLSPLSIVELSEQHSKTPNRVIKEVAMLYVPQQIPVDPKRQVMALFVAEALTRTLTYSMADEPLYAYLTRVAQYIDTADSLGEFADVFLVRLSELLGYGGTMMDEFRTLRSRELIALL